MSRWDELTDELSVDDISRIIQQEIRKLGATHTLHGGGAEDIAQEVLLKLLEKGNLIKLGDDYVTTGVNEKFIRTATQFKYIDTYRKDHGQASLDSRSSEDTNRTIDIPDDKFNENRQIGWLDGKNMIDEAEHSLPNDLRIAFRY